MAYKLSDKYNSASEHFVCDPDGYNKSRQQEVRVALNLIVIYTAKIKSIGCGNRASIEAYMIACTDAEKDIYSACYVDI